MSPFPRADLAVLVPAAGAGERLGRGPKAFLPLDGRPLLAWLAEKARTVAAEVVIAAPADALQRAAALAPGCRVVAGGASRQETVARLLAASTAPWVLLQDVARPFASAGLLRVVAEAARETGAAGAFHLTEVPVARIVDGRVAEDLRPGQAGVFQAPQAFARTLLAEVLESAAREGWTEQSTLQLVLRAGLPVRAVAGEKTNIKLTTEEDWRMANALTDRLR